MDGKGIKKLPKELRGKSGVDDLTEAGTLLGAVGGTIIGTSALTAWVRSGGSDLTVFNLVDVNRLYILLLVAQLLALVCAMISAIMLKSSNWPRERKVPWAIPLVSFNVVMVILIAISFVLMEGDYLGIDPSSSYGPGPFLAVFGLMFSWVGALMFVLDTRQRSRSQPAPRQFQRQRTSPSERREPVERSYVECPNCGEEVPDDSPMCPNCRAILSDDDQSETRSDEEDLDEVR
jgi:hypothetical protein